MNLKNPIPVTFKNVLQYFWEYESTLSGKDSCSKTCDDYQYKDYTGGDGCFGAARDCENRYTRKTGRTDKLETTLVSYFDWLQSFKI